VGGTDNEQVLRIDAETGVAEVVATYSGGLSLDMTVSSDGARAVTRWRGNCYVESGGICVNVLDLTNGTGRLIAGHCGPCLSPSGTYFGQDHAQHEHIWIYKVDEIETYSYERDHMAGFVDTIPVHNSKPRWSTSSDDWLVAVHHWSDGHRTGQVLAHMPTRTIDTLAIYDADPCDFWPGALPPPEGDNPAIALNTTSLSFVALTPDDPPASQTVIVSNGGAGTLGQVNVSDDADWLIVTVSAGDTGTQKLTNTVEPSSLGSGTHSATVTVSGGGAVSSATYTVTLTVGSDLPAPTALTAVALGAGRVSLGWQDNASDETGYAVERGDGQSWQEIVRVAADTITHVDTGVTGGREWFYRVRAFRDTVYSAYSDSVGVDVPVAASITVQEPRNGAVYEPGDTLRIVWSAQGVASVGILYSTDAGDNFQTVPLLGEGVGSVFPSDALWGNYPFVVPDTSSSECLIQVYDYNDPQTTAFSGVFSVQETGVSQVASQDHRILNGRSAPARAPLVRSGSSVAVHVAPGQVAHVTFYRLNGSVAAESYLNGTSTARTLRIAAPSSPGCYLVRAHRSSGVRP